MLAGTPRINGGGSGGGGSGTVTAITASTGITLTPNPITATGTVGLTIPVVISSGGTNSTTALSGSSIMISNGTGIIQGTAGTTTTVLHGNAAGAPTYGAVVLTTDVSGILPVANGGTGSATAPYVNDATNATLARSGTGPYTLGLNLGNANVWTGKQTFGTSNPAITSGGLDFTAGAVSTLGTTDNFALAFKTNGTEVGRATAGGRFYWGVVTPTHDANAVIEGSSGGGFGSVGQNTTNTAAAGEAFAGVWSDAGGVSIESFGSLFGTTALRNSGSITTTAGLTGGFTFIVNANAPLNFQTTATTRMTILGGGNIGIGITSPTATLHLKAGTATAGTSPLKFNSGTLLTTAEAGAEEFLTDKWYGTITTGAVRKEFTLNDAALTSGTIPVATTNGRLTDSGFTSSNVLTKTSTVTATGQTADIGSTNLTTTGAGLYRLAYYLVDSVADLTAGAVRLNVTYTDAGAAQTQQSATVALTVLGTFTQGEFIIQLASGNIAYSTTHTGILGTAAYNLYITLERLN